MVPTTQKRAPIDRGRLDCIAHHMGTPDKRLHEERGALGWRSGDQDRIFCKSLRPLAITIFSLPWGLPAGGGGSGGGLGVTLADFFAFIPVC